MKLGKATLRIITVKSTVINVVLIPGYVTSTFLIKDTKCVGGGKVLGQISISVVTTKKGT